MVTFLIEYFLKLTLLLAEYIVMPIALFILVFKQRSLVENAKSKDSLYSYGLEFMMISFASTLSLALRCLDMYANFAGLLFLVALVEFIWVFFLIEEIHRLGPENNTALTKPNIGAAIYQAFLIVFITIYCSFSISIRYVGTAVVISLIAVFCFCIYWFAKQLHRKFPNNSNLKKVGMDPQIVDISKIITMGVHLQQKSAWDEALSLFIIALGATNKELHQVRCKYYILKCYINIGKSDYLSKAAMLAPELINHYCNIDDALRVNEMKQIVLNLAKKTDRTFLLKQIKHIENTEIQEELLQEIEGK